MYAIFNKLIDVNKTNQKRNEMKILIIYTVISKVGISKSRRGAVYTHMYEYELIQR